MTTLIEKCTAAVVAITIVMLSLSAVTAVPLAPELTSAAMLTIA